MKRRDLPGRKTARDKNSEKKSEEERTFEQFLDERERKIREAGLKHEPFKPSRYVEYYEHGPGTLPPTFFMSMDEEYLRGSSPGSFLSDWVKKHQIDQKTLDKRVPQIRLVPKEELAEYLLARIKKAKVTTPQERKELDSEHPSIKRNILEFVREELAAIDWAEQTHGLRIDVDPAILKWIGKV